MHGNLTEMATGKISFKKAMSALENLGNASEGPLRATVTAGIPHLGVRTWGQFFDEHVFGDHLNRQALEKETSKIVENYIPLITNAYRDTGLSDEEKRANTIRMNNAIYKLRAKVEGVNLNPKLGAFVNVVGATTMPGYKNGETRSATVESFGKKVLIPKGLSMGTVPIEKVIAQRRFGHWFYSVKNDEYGRSEPCQIDSGETRHPEDYYYNFYKDVLATVKDNETSVAIELYFHPRFKIPDAHRNGAWRAASEFIASRKAKSNYASVLLCLDKMPEVRSRPLRVSKPKNAGLTNVVVSSSATLTNAARNQKATGQADNLLIPANEADDESES